MSKINIKNTRVRGIELNCTDREPISNLIVIKRFVESFLELSSIQKITEYLYFFISSYIESNKGLYNYI